MFVAATLRLCAAVVLPAACVSLAALGVRAVAEARAARDIRAGEEAWMRRVGPSLARAMVARGSGASDDERVAAAMSAVGVPAADAIADQTEALNRADFERALGVDLREDDEGARHTLGALARTLLAHSAASADRAGGAAHAGWTWWPAVPAAARLVATAALPVLVLPVARRAPAACVACAAWSVAWALDSVLAAVAAALQARAFANYRTACERGEF